MELVTLPAVAIVRTGTYELASGTTTFTEEDIRAASEAFATDPAVKAPRIKIASLEKALGLDPADHGGEPAFGWADNLTVSANGQELLADIHVPEWISAAMEFAYPSLSIEGTPPGWISATGRKHDLVITAVALLGVHWPGITTIDDFREVLANGPDLAEAEDTAVLARIAPQLRQASMDGDLVVRRFLDQLDDGELPLPEAIASSWDVWPRSLRFDDDGTPYLKATDEATGTLYRIDFTVAENEVTFAEFVEVVEQDVPVAAMAARPAPAIMAFNSREAVRASVAHPASPSSTTTITEDEHPMTDVQRRNLAVAHGLDPETASEDDIHAAAQKAAEGTPPNPATPPAPNADNPGEVVTEGGEGAKLNPSDPSDERTATVSTAKLAELERAAAAGVAAAVRQTHADRDGIVLAAIEKGCITPAESGLGAKDPVTGLYAVGDTGWRRDLENAPEVITAALGRLRPTFPGASARGSVAPQAGGADRADLVIASISPQSNDDRKVIHR